MIRVLIVEDSAVEQQLLARMLGADPQIAVVGVAEDGEKALAAMERLQPDVITMDIHMPKLNGFETTRRIMETRPVPIVIVSGSYAANDVDKTFRAMEAGALAVVRKPRGPGHPDYPEDRDELLRTVKMMSEIKVVKRWPRLRGAFPAPPLPTVDRATVPAAIRVIAIGASTGGPAALQTIFAHLPKDLSVPVLVVQHMAAGFIESFVKWLDATTGFPARVAVHGESLLPGHAYFAPDGLHLLLGRDERIVLRADPPENGLRPAVARLFRSVAESCGAHAAGVLLTGMGRDGADELKLLRSKGAVTVVQDQESSIIFGMPAEAIRLDAADFVLPPERIALFLAQLSKNGDVAADRRGIPADHGQA